MVLYLIVYIIDMKLCWPLCMYLYFLSVIYEFCALSRDKGQGVVLY